MGGSAAASHPENSGEAKGKRGFVRWDPRILKQGNWPFEWVILGYLGKPERKPNHDGKGLR